LAEVVTAIAFVARFLHRTFRVLDGAHLSASHCAPSDPELLPYFHHNCADYSRGIRHAGRADQGRRELSFTRNALPVSALPVCACATGQNPDRE
jgi:hypothetical protein